MNLKFGSKIVLKNVSPTAVKMYYLERATKFGGTKVEFPADTVLTEGDFEQKLPTSVLIGDLLDAHDKIIKEQQVRYIHNNLSKTAIGRPVYMLYRTDYADHYTIKKVLVRFGKKYEEIKDVVPKGKGLPPKEKFDGSKLESPEFGMLKKSTNEIIPIIINCYDNDMHENLIARQLRYAALPKIAYNAKTYAKKVKVAEEAAKSAGIPFDIDNVPKFRVMKEPEIEYYHMDGSPMTTDEIEEVKKKFPEHKFVNVVQNIYIDKVLKLTNKAIERKVL